VAVAEPPAPAPAEPEPLPAVAAAVTSSGYAKRVRGANAPKTSVLAARTDQDAERPDGPRGAEGMRAALSAMHAGMQRGRTEEAHTDDSAGGRG
jgi:hypothetical protein